MIQVARNVSMADVGFLESGWLLPPGRCLAVLGEVGDLSGRKLWGDRALCTHPLRAGMRR